MRMRREKRRGRKSGARREGRKEWPFGYYTDSGHCPLNKKKKFQPFAATRESGLLEFRPTTWERAGIATPRKGGLR